MPNVSDPSDETAELASPAPTAELPAVPKTFRGSQLGLLFVAVAAGSFLMGIGISSLTKPSTSDRIVGSRDVGPSGGVIRFDGGELRVPEGALSQIVSIVIRRSTVDDRVRVDAADAPIVFEPGKLSAYTFAPADLTFAKPVELTFRLPRGARNGTVFARRGTGIVLLSGVVDADRGVATTTVSDFRFDGNAP